MRQQIKIKRRILYLSPLFLLAISLVAPFLSASKASAAQGFGYQYSNTSYTQIDGPLPGAPSVIVRYTNAGSSTGFFSHTLTTDDQFKDNALNGCGVVRIKTNDGKYDGDSSAQIQPQEGFGTPCGGKYENWTAISISNPYKKPPTAASKPADLINNFCNGNNACVTATTNECQQYQSTFNPKSVDTKFNACVAGFALGYTGGTNNCSGGVGSSSNVQLCNQEYNKGKQAVSSGNNDRQLGCDAQLDNPLTWILCPVISILDGMINEIDGWITQELTVPSSAIFGTNSCSSSDPCYAYHQAWASFRNIALGLMVIAGLVIVISQALGIEILDAYTIRKTLPRLLIAAIGISLSWPLMQFAVNFTNDLGFGVRHLIYAPFANLNGNIHLSFGDGVGSSLENFFFGAAGLAVVGVAAVVMIGIIMSLAATAALAVFIAIIVLVLRQVAIILLILVAPIAIVAYVLPNTQNVYKFWWESFSKALLMFPLIAAFIAAGRVFSAVTLASNPDLLGQIIGFLAYFAPYFLIPATVKLAGGAVRQIGGLVNDRSRGAFDRLRKNRANTMERVGKKAVTGGFKGIGLIPGSHAAARAANRVGLGIGAGFSGRYGFGVRGQSAMGNLRQQAGLEAQQSPGMKSIAGKNDFNRVLAEGNGNAERGRQGLINHFMQGGDDGDFVNSFIRGAGGDEALGRARAATEARRRADFAVKSVKPIGFTENNAAAALLNLAADGTALRDVDDQMRLAALVSNGNANNAFTIASQAGKLSRGAGRPGLAPASTETGNLVFSHFNEMNPGNRQPISDKPHEALVREAVQSGIGGEIAYSLLGNAKSRDIESHVENSLAIVKNHQKAADEGRESEYTQDEAERAAAALVDMQRNVEAGTGKLDNRRKAIETFDKDREGVEALQQFLAAPSVATDPNTKQVVSRGTKRVRAEGPIPPNGAVPTVEVPITNADHIEGMVARNWSNIPEAERQGRPPEPEGGGGGGGGGT